MARSEYIYLALPETGPPVLACTVRHEFTARLGQRLDRGRLTLWRCQDAGSQTPRQITLAELGIVPA